MVEQRLKHIPGVVAFGRRTGRAELDEHAEGVNMSEIIVTLRSRTSGRSREEILDDIREELTQVPGVAIAVEQPLQHVISQMLSGVKAQIGIKLYGDNLDILRRKADEIKAAIEDVPGVKDLMVEQQIEIPQLRIDLDRDALAAHGLNADDVNELVETAMNGRVVSEIVLGERKFDLLVRLDDPFRNDPQELRRLTLDLPRGGQIPLNAVAEVRGIQRPEHDQPRERAAADHRPVQHGRPGPGQRRGRNPAPAGPDPGLACHRLLHPLRRPVREPAVGDPDHRPVEPGLAGLHVPRAVHAVPLAEPQPAGAGRPADGGDRGRGGAGHHRPIADRGQHGRIHLPGGHRLAQRHPADRPLSAPGRATKGSSSRRR